MAKKSAEGDLKLLVSGGVIRLDTGETFGFTFGALEITLRPPAARTAGARWRIAGSANNYQSGDRLPLPIGKYTVQFTRANGFVKPDPMEVIVQPDSDASSYSAKYERDT